MNHSLFSTYYSIIHESLGKKSLIQGMLVREWKRENFLRQGRILMRWRKITKNFWSMMMHMIIQPSTKTLFQCIIQINNFFINKLWLFIWSMPKYLFDMVRFLFDISSNKLKKTFPMVWFKHLFSKIFLNR